MLRGLGSSIRAGYQLPGTGRYEDSYSREPDDCQKIAIGGGINEPLDALLTILYGLLTNPDLEKRCEKVENKTSSGRY